MEFTATSNVQMGLVDATEAELVVAFDEVGNTNIGDGGFVIDEADEQCYRV